MRQHLLGKSSDILSDWGIATPTSYGPIGSLDDHGLAEFLLVLHRQ